LRVLERPHGVLSLLFRRVDLIISRKLQDKGVLSMYAGGDEMNKAIELDPSLIEGA